MRYNRQLNACRFVLPGSGLDSGLRCERADDSNGRELRRLLTTFTTYFLGLSVTHVGKKYGCTKVLLI